MQENRQQRGRAVEDQAQHEHENVGEKKVSFTKQPEIGYGRFLVSQLGDPDVLVLVAENETGIVGYAYADIEPLSWRDLRGPCGIVEDVFVDENARQQGAGRALMEAAVAWIRSRGRSQVVLSTMSGNEAAQRLFERLGFRRTMIEMTLDAAEPGVR